MQTLITHTNFLFRSSGRGAGGFPGPALRLWALIAVALLLGRLAWRRAQCWKASRPKRPLG